MTRSCIAAALGLLALAGCQTAATVEEAKKLEVVFEDQSFTPPPRHVDDIAALLRDVGQPRRGWYRRQLAAATAAPPEGADALTLARFHLERARARGRLSMLSEHHEDLREGLRHAREARGTDRRLYRQLLNLVAAAERTLGNLRDAVEMNREAVREEPAPGSYQNLVVALLTSGQIEEAIAAEEEGNRRIQRIRARLQARGRLSPEIARRLKLVESRMRAAILNNTGKWREAEPYMLEVLHLLGEAGVKRRGRRIRPLLALSRNYRLQRRLVEAEIAAREGLTLALNIRGVDHSLAASGLRDLALVLLDQGRDADAELLLKRSFEAFEAAGVPRHGIALASAQFHLGGIRAAQGDWAGALGHFDRLREDLAENRFFYDKLARVDATIPLVLVKSGRADEAVALLTPALESDLRVLGADNAGTAEKFGVLGMALAARGDVRGALEAYGKAIPVLIAQSGPQAADEEADTGANWRIGAILESYLDFLIDRRSPELDAMLGGDAVAEAFRIADISRAHKVQAALAASGARAAAGDPALAQLIRREQDLGRQIAALLATLGNISATPAEQRSAESAAKLQARIATLRDERAALRRRIDADFPDYAALVRPQPVAVERLQQVLKPDEALVATLVTARRTLVWAIPKSGKAAFAVVPKGRDALERAVQALRASLDPQARTLGDIPPFDVETAHALYASLLQPVAAGWEKAKSVFVVGHDVLGRLPFQVLVTREVALPPAERLLFSRYRGVPWLIRERAVTALPSVTSLVGLRRSQPAQSAARPFFGVGDPWFSARQAAQARAQPVARQVAAATTARGAPVSLRNLPSTRGLSSADLSSLPRLPETAEEIARIAAVLKADPARDVLTGERATEEAVRTTDLRPYRVISFATHGLVPGDLDGLTEPALALTAPAVGGSRGDGLLTMSEVLSMRLNADWVVLSACNTGAADGRGAEAFSGLGRAFFYAGARALLLSNWPVHSAATTLLMTELFRRHAENPSLPRAEALRRAMLHLIDDGAFVDAARDTRLFAYAHPLFWAPFSVVGDGGATAGDRLLSHPTVPLPALASRAAMPSR